MRNSVHNMLFAFRNDDRGATAIIFGLAVFAIALLSGLAMDFSRVRGQRTSLQAAADAAVLAIGHDQDITAKNIEQRASDFVKANLSTAVPAQNITVKAAEFDGGAGVRVTINAKVDTLLLGMFGVNSMSVDAIAEARYSSTKVELALALDNTGSMAGTKLATLKSASTAMVENLLPAGANRNNVKIGIVPFDLSVNIGTDQKGQPWLTNTDGYKECTRWKKGKGKKKGGGASKQCVAWKTYDWKGCVAPRKEPDDATDKAPIGNYRYEGVYDNATDCGIAKVTTLSSDPATLKTDITKMRANGWTYVPIGLEWGWRLLAPEAPFAGAAAYNDKDWQKILVLMTDGANTVQWKQQGSDYLPSTGVSSSKADARTKLICRAIKDKGITIYTVAFQVSNKTTRKMLEECATDTGKYFDAQNSAALEAAFAKISGDINNLRLSK